MSAGSVTSYTLLLTGEFSPEQLTAALAGATGVPVGAIDVAHLGSCDRSMDADVYATYEPVAGNVAWMLDVSVSGAVADPPGWEQLGAALATGLGQPVLYEAEPQSDTAYWLASPEGWRTRARVDDIEPPDGWGGIAVDVQAVARKVDELPSVPVETDPE
jgi:hypothetical protein